MSDVQKRVTAIQGNPVSKIDPTTGQVLEWNGSKWIPTNLPDSLPPSGPGGDGGAGGNSGPSPTNGGDTSANSGAGGGGGGQNTNSGVGGNGGNGGSGFLRIMWIA